jgi:hypothetical protein
MKLVILQDSEEGQILLATNHTDKKAYVKTEEFKTSDFILLEKELKIGLGHWEHWVTYRLNHAINSADARLSYAYFCCGHLSYYDEITRNGCIDHQITFLWKNGNTEVTILLNPGPNTSKKSKYINYPRANYPQADYFRGKKVIVDGKLEYTEIPDDEYLATPAGGGIDPQPPPAPPPPPQYS